MDDDGSSLTWATDPDILEAVGICDYFDWITIYGG